MYAFLYIAPAEIQNLKVVNSQIFRSIAFLLFFRMKSIFPLPIMSSLKRLVQKYMPPTCLLYGQVRNAVDISHSFWIFRL